MHRVLERQIKRFVGDVKNIPPGWVSFFNTVSNTYSSYDKDNELLGRSLELSSKEFSENNRLLAEAKTGVEKIVQQRTLELENIKKLLEVKNKSLEAALSAKDDFIRIANHQLNTPISIMQNAYTMVRDKSLTLKQGVEYWGIGLGKISHVVKDFWNVLQFDEEIKYNIQKTDIVPTIEHSVENAKKVCITSKKNIKIVIEKASFSVPPILCDIEKMDHVIHNLIDNAMNYTEKGTITISYQMFKDNTYLKVNIKDTGIGFSPINKEKLSQKFYRAKNALLFHPDGSGLGLYICKNIIENNGGELLYESEGEGKGATFSFTLPVASALGGSASGGK